MQHLSYLEDTYRAQAETRVLATGETDGEVWVAVEHCLFHPQGGGQPADRGWIDGIEVAPLRQAESGLVVAKAAEGEDLPALAAGQPVQARIDIEARKLHAALHTAGHLIEAAGRAQGWVLAGNIHFPGQARIEFTDESSDSRLAEPEGREQVTVDLRKFVQDAITADLPVTAETDEAGRRTVSIGTVHSAACGGTHVKSLGDLADVELPPLKVKKGRIKVSYTGHHADRW